MTAKYYQWRQNLIRGAALSAPLGEGDIYVIKKAQEIKPLLNGYAYLNGEPLLQKKRLKMENRDSRRNDRK